MYFVVFSVGNIHSKCVLNVVIVFYVLCVFWAFPFVLLFVGLCVRPRKPFGNVSLIFWFRPMKMVHASTETHEVIILVFTPQLFHVNQAKIIAVKLYPSFCKIAIVFETFKHLLLLKIKELNNETLTLSSC